MKRRFTLTERNRMVDIRILDKGDVSKLKISNLMGQKIGPYLVDSYAGKGLWNNSKTEYHLWNATCDCGTSVTLKNAFFKDEDKVVCICDRFNGDYEKYKNITKRHKGIINKCYHEESVSETLWPKFGGRVCPVSGKPEPIGVCDAWHDKYVFAKDIERTIGFPPDKGWYLKLIDESKDFSPENVQWCRTMSIRIKDERNLMITLTIQPSMPSEYPPVPVHKHLVNLIELNASISSLLKFPAKEDNESDRERDSSEAG